jgi:hypothetical protein
MNADEGGGIEDGVGKGGSVRGAAASLSEDASAVSVEADDEAAMAPRRGGALSRLAGSESPVASGVRSTGAAKERGGSRISWPWYESIMTADAISTRS